METLEGNVLDIDQLRSQTKESAPPPQRERRSLLIPALAILAILATLVAGILVYTTRQKIVGSDAHDMATSWISTHQVVQSKLGEDLSFGFMPRGVVDDEAATLAYNLYGDLDNGSVTLELNRREDNWDVTAAVLQSDKGGRLVLEMEREGDAGPDPQSEHHVLRGAGLINTGRVSEALKELELAVITDPHNANAYYWRGRAWQESGDTDKAMVDFEKALELDAELAGPHHGVGLVYVSKGEFEAALTHFDRYLELSPDDGMAWQDRGYAHFKLDHLDAAKADAAKSCELGFDLGCAALEQLGGSPAGDAP